MPMIEFQNVAKHYEGSGPALSGISFSIEKGEMVFLSGASGAGKSTLLKLIAAIERPTTGAVRGGGRGGGRPGGRRPARGAPRARPGGAAAAGAAGPRRAS